MKNVIRKILSVLAIMLIALGISSADSEGLLFPTACLVVGGVIAFILYETADDDDYI